jgi:hypothetical protein
MDRSKASKDELSNIEMVQHFLARGAGGGGALTGHFLPHEENILTGWHTIGP